jgi:hypothetical protein
MQNGKRVECRRCRFNRVCVDQFDFHCYDCSRMLKPESLSDILASLAEPKPVNAKRPGSIYFLKPEGMHFVKIGFTNGSVKDRVLSLAAGCPVPLNLICSFPGDVITERNLHQNFAAHHSRREWFVLHKEIEDFIDSVKAS